MMEALVTQNRSYRRFDSSVAITPETLRALVELARLSASGRNAQPLKYLLSCTPEQNALIFQHLAWAAYLKDWPGPAEGERPTAYIVVLGDKQISQTFGIDPGLAIQNILLGAVERGLGGCILGSVRREELRQALALPERYEILYVVALGKPAEMVVVEPVGPDGDTRYWRDAAGVHHVPKRALDEIILAWPGG